jgi:hypothetical protein
MKKTLATLALTVAVVSSGLAQGFVIFSNPGNEKISTNSVVGGGSAGNISANGGTVGSTYYFALFYSASATTVSGSSAAVAGAGNYVVNDGSWTFDNPSSGQAGGFTFGPGYATNLTSSGQFASEFIDGSQNGTLVPFTTAAQFVVVGWSGAIGSTIGALQSYLANPTFTAWVGESAVSGSITPGNPNASPATTPPNLFGTSSPQMTKFLLGEIAPVPEPTTIALASLGGLSLLAFRRRNKA